MLDFKKYNKEVAEWAKSNKGDIKKNAAQSGIKHRKNSESKGPSILRLKSTLKEQEGAVNKVTFGFPRSLIWTHKGAGKGRGGTVGSKWVDKYGNNKSTKFSSLGKMGTKGRTAKPFINDILNSSTGVDNLASIAAEHLGDALIGSLLIN